MTVIAWDGKTLAGDRMCADTWTTRAVTKIRRARGGDALVGAAGDADRCRALLAWFDRMDAAAPEPPFPSHLQTAGAADATLLVVWRDGAVHLYQREPHPIELQPGLHAIGSGAEAALAAMYCGKTSAEAVDVAAIFCRGVGLGVDELRF